MIEVDDNSEDTESEIMMMMSQSALKDWVTWGEGEGIS